MNAKTIKEYIEETKKKYPNNDDVQNVLEELEADPSLDSIIAGTTLTALLCREDDK